MKQKDNCFKCEYKRNVPGNAHISCAKPDLKMRGHAHGVANGWFIYPYCFDPVWKIKECQNFKLKAELCS